MGFAKDRMLYEQSLGLSGRTDKHVCLKCITNDYLCDHFDGAQESDSCDYCRRTSRGKPIGVPINDLLEVLGSAIKSEYCDPAEELPHESAEGGYQGQVLDAHDLIGELEEFTEDSELLDDVAIAFSEQSWCERDYFASKKDEALSSAWERFKHKAKHVSPFRIHDKDPDDDNSLGAGDIAIHEFLLELGFAAVDLDRVHILQTSEVLYRARLHAANERPSTAGDLGSPPPERVKRPNRMSPVGVSVFYAALDPATAQLEVLPKRRRQEMVTTGVWRPMRDLQLLDLTGDIHIPSLYDEDRRAMRRAIFFLKRFAADISKPLSATDEAALEYLPTQIVTDFFRKSLPQRTIKVPVNGQLKETVLSESMSIDGIVYKSAANPKGKCVVVYAGPNDCCDGGSASSGRTPPLLSVDCQSIVRVPATDVRRPRKPQARR